MASWIFNWFMNEKRRVAIDEARRYHRSLLNLSHHGIQSLDDSSMEQIYYSHIIKLLLGFNDLRTLPNKFGLFSQNLVVLSLAYNKFEEIPEVLGELSGLHVLNMSHNPLISGRLPSSLSNLTHLQILQANNSNIRDIPDELHNIRQLSLIELRNNQLTTVPVQLVNSKYLKWITLEGNEIEVIPIELSQAKFLVHLNLSRNQIQKIPDKIWEYLSNLRYVFLASNKFIVDEDVVQQMKLIPKLKKADLSNNKMLFECNPELNNLQKFVVTPATEIIFGKVEVEEIWKSPNFLPEARSEMLHDPDISRHTNSPSQSELVLVPTTDVTIESKVKVPSVEKVLTDAIENGRMWQMKAKEISRVHIDFPSSECSHLGSSNSISKENLIINAMTPSNSNPNSFSINSNTDFHESQPTSSPVQINILQEENDENSTSKLTFLRFEQIVEVESEMEVTLEVPAADVQVEVLGDEDVIHDDDGRNLEFLRIRGAMGIDQDENSTSDWEESIETSNLDDVWETGDEVEDDVDEMPFDPDPRLALYYTFLA